MERIGRYELVGVLGRGGMGVVYEGVLHGPGGFRMPVAVKVLHEGGELLRREARIGGLLRHRHLVDVYEVAEQDGRWFCAMELCRGGSLAAYQPLPPRAVVEVGLAVCDALQHAYEELGLVHLDLKPENLLLRDGEVKVADLGIARADGFASDGRIRGTRGYMAPEQSRGEPLDARADVYALGVTLVELATGSRTSPATMDLWDLDAIEGGQDIPSWLQPAVDRCLEHAPDDRWPSMRELAEALRSLQADGPGLREVTGASPAAAPAPRTGAGRGPEPDVFVGRHHEMAELTAALASPGVVVLKGPAGIGKSRLANAIARRWPGDAWSCDLSAARSLDGLLYAVASALDVPLAPGGLQAQARQLGHAIAGRPAALLVLDNVEQIGEIASVVQQWSQQAADARILSTTRAALPLEGARVLDLGPLPPADAAALLVERGLQRGMDIADDPRLGELAQRLDGVPLALELAAGRLGVLSVSDVLERLGLSLLRSATGDRHSTLSAALDLSWDLLSPTERSALAQLSVFAGGFTLEAAEEVLDVDSPFDAVCALVDASLVASAAAGRHALLAGIREYAAEKLAGDARPAARHGRCFARFGAPEVVVSLDRRGGRLGRRALALDLDNLLAACRRAVARDDAATATSTLRAAWAVMEVRGPFQAAADLAASVTGAPSLTDSHRSDAVRVLAAALRLAGRPEDGRAFLDTALAAVRERNDPRAEALLLTERGLVSANLGRVDEARALLETALEVHRALEDRRSETIVLNSLGLLDKGQGRMSEAHGRFEEALGHARALADVRWEGIVVGNLGQVHAAQGRRDEARRHYEDGLRAARGIGDRRFEGIQLANLGASELDAGQIGPARDHLLAARQLFGEIGERRQEGITLANLGNLEQAGDRLDEALEHYRAALLVMRDVGDRHYEGLVLANMGTLYLERGEPDRAREQLDPALAIAVDVGDRRMEAYLLGQLAFAEATASPETSLARLDRAEALSREIGSSAFLAACLAIRAEVCWRAGDAASARAALAEAESEASAIADHPHASRAIARAHALLSSPV